jgi:hypothetical protein
MEGNFIDAQFTTNKKKMVFALTGSVVSWATKKGAKVREIINVGRTEAFVEGSVRYFPVLFVFLFFSFLLFFFSSSFCCSLVVMSETDFVGRKTKERPRLNPAVRWKK